MWYVVGYTGSVGKMEVTRGYDGWVWYETDRPFNGHLMINRIYEIGSMNTR